MHSITIQNRDTTTNETGIYDLILISGRSEFAPAKEVFETVTLAPFEIHDFTTLPIKLDGSEDLSLALRETNAPGTIRTNFRASAWREPTITTKIPEINP